MRLFMLICFFGLAACKKSGHINGPSEEIVSAFDRVRARESSENVVARFHIKLRSKPLKLAGSTSGGLVLARPHSARLDINAPIGPPLLSLVAYDGALQALLLRKGRYLVAEHADEVASELSGGLASIDDLFALLQGRLPFSSLAYDRSEVLESGALRMVLLGPESTSLWVDLDAASSTLRHVELRQGERVHLTVDYGDYEEVAGELFPSELTIEIPAFELVAELRYRKWTVVEQAPDVFELQIPKSITTEALEDVVRGLSAAR